MTAGYLFLGVGAVVAAGVVETGAAGGVIDCSQFGIFHTGTVS